jgi:hypothetical protein
LSTFRPVTISMQELDLVVPGERTEKKVNFEGIFHEGRHCNYLSR